MIIGMCGKKRHGKTEAAQGLTKLGFHRHLFAAPLKRLSSYLIMNREELHDNQSLGYKLVMAELSDITKYIDKSITIEDILMFLDQNNIDLNQCALEQKPRILLQYLGCQFFRAYSDDVWVCYMKDTIESQLPNTHIVIDDCRFLNEVELLNKYNAVFIKVVNPHVEDDHDQHQSENDLNDFNEIDHIVYNSGSIEELHDMVCKTVLTSYGTYISYNV